MKKEVPIQFKLNLTAEEAAAYSNIGIVRIRTMCADENCPFTLRVGRRILIKRHAFDEYISKAYSI